MPVRNFACLRFNEGEDTRRLDLGQQVCQHSQESPDSHGPACRNARFFAKRAFRIRCDLPQTTLLYNGELNAAIPKPSLVGVIAGKRFCVAVSLTDEHRGIDALVHKVSSHSVSSRLRELEI
jgi:hypothetical protein